ncbi:hypothetical protein [Arthrobacter sp.]|uniref:hypothetical protein n=1 Tax=Arthrobacter sp. TaxID=1667 RepID=UPI0033949EF6
MDHIRPSVRSGAGAGTVFCSAPVEFLIDQGEEFAGCCRSSESLDLGERFAQLHEVFSGYQGPPESNRMWIAGRPMEDWLGATVGPLLCGVR